MRLSAAASATLSFVLQDAGSGKRAATASGTISGIDAERPASSKLSGGSERALYTDVARGSPPNTAPPRLQRIRAAAE
jgi:hypothetical protein